MFKRITAFTHGFLCGINVISIPILGIVCWLLGGYDYKRNHDEKE